MSRRALILKELGLTPLWMRRGGGAAEALGETPRPALQVAPAASTLEDAPGRNIPVQAAASGRAAAIAQMDWTQLRASASACTACVLHKQRKQAVPGVGDEKAEWLFIGEAPGAEEDARGEPFVGQAGKLLDSMLAAIELKRGENVYIANVVKCRPPGNRNPEPGEASACEPYLTRQIELIRPKLIVALGKVAAQNLLGSDATISSMRGRLHAYRGTPLIVTYHPAYLLRTLGDKAKSWEDLCFAVATMKSLKPAAVDPN